MLFAREIRFVPLHWHFPFIIIIIIIIIITCTHQDVTKATKKSVSKY